MKSALALAGVLLVAGVVAAQTAEESAEPAEPGDATGAPGAAASDAVAPPRVAILVVAPPEVDAFLPAYVHELAAAVLREAGWSVVPPGVAKRAFAEAGGEGCLGDGACLEALGAELGAGMVLALWPSEEDAEGARFACAAQWYRAGEGAMAPVGEREVLRGDETAIAEGVQAAARRADRGGAPCLVEVAAEGVEVSAEVDRRARALHRGRLFVAPGDHALRLLADGRRAWEGPLRCEAGRGWRARVR